jgi:hypothetical protein
MARCLIQASSGRSSNPAAPSLADDAVSSRTQRDVGIAEGDENTQHASLDVRSIR